MQRKSQKGGVEIDAPTVEKRDALQPHALMRQSGPQTKEEICSASTTRKSPWVTTLDPRESRIAEIPIAHTSMSCPRPRMKKNNCKRDMKKQQEKREEREAKDTEGKGDRGKGDRDAWGGYKGKSDRKGKGKGNKH